MDQEMLPCGQGTINSVEINPSLLMMREWAQPICHCPWARGENVQEFQSNSARFHFPPGFCTLHQTSVTICHIPSLAFLPTRAQILHDETTQVRHFHRSFYQEYTATVPEGQSTAMHSTEAIINKWVVVHCCPLLTICPRCCPRHPPYGAPDMRQMMPQTWPR